MKHVEILKSFGLDGPGCMVFRNRLLKAGRELGILKYVLFWCIRLWPNVLLVVLSSKLYIPRANFNIDYLLIWAAFPNNSKKLLVVLLTLVASLDLLATMDAVYFFRLDQVVAAVPSFPQLSIYQWAICAGYVAGTAAMWTIAVKLPRPSKTSRAGLIILTAILICADRRFKETNIATSGMWSLQIALREAVETTKQLPSHEKLELVPSALEIGLQNVSLQSPKLDIYLFIVEALALPDLPLLTDWILPASWHTTSPLIQGTVPFTGSTTSAELRELCGVSASFANFSQVQAKECLPNKLKARGYITHAFHGYTSKLFNRARWLPKTGIDSMHFTRELFSEGLRSNKECGDAFLGVCDADVAERILRRVDTNAQSKFIYWLTLNSHLPVHGKNFRASRLECADRFPFLSPDVCAWASAERLTLATITYMLEKIGKINRKSRVIVVGDHAPPFIVTDDRSLFPRRSVPFWTFEFSQY